MTVPALRLHHDVVVAAPPPGEATLNNLCVVGQGAGATEVPIKRNLLNFNKYSIN